MNSLSYFAPAFFLFTVHIAMEAFRSDVLPKVLSGVVSDPNNSQFYNSFVYTIDFIYVILICSIVFFSLHLTNGNKKYKPYLYAISTIFGIFSLIVFIVLLVDVIRGIVDNAACNIRVT
jgi:glucan phosphoethanolaminetransferase (alkaline phosphatase superfamily)